MIRTILALAVGFWLGRQVYISYALAEALKKKQPAKPGLKDWLDNKKLGKPNP